MPLPSASRRLRRGRCRRRDRIPASSPRRRLVATGPVAAGAAAWLSAIVGCAGSPSPEGATPPAEPPASSIHTDAAPVRAIASLARDDRRPDVVEARSLAGAPLHRPPLDPATRASLQANLEQAWAAWETAPTEEESIIWLGRRLAYLGRYRDAITVYGAGLELHPESIRLRRHRGHRFITVRDFDAAVVDLAEAERLADAAGAPDAIEPDGAPNARNIPLTTTRSNITYHLALAHYLRGDHRAALETHDRGRAWASGNDDQRVSRGYWIYRALRESGRDAEARAVLLEALRPRMEIIENSTYHQLLIEYRDGVATTGDPASASTVDDATLGFGRGAELRADGRLEEGDARLRAVVDGDASWAAFGFIAAEAALADGVAASASE